MEDLGRLHLKGVLLGLVFSSMVGRPCSCCAPRQYIRGEATLEIPEIGAETAETSSRAELDNVVAAEMLPKYDFG